MGLDSTWTRAPADDVYLNAIAELGEDPRRASLAIRRQSLLQSQQASSEPGQPDVRRGSIARYQRQSSVQDGPGQRIAALRKQSILGERTGPNRTWSAAERRPQDGRGSVAGDRRWSTADARRGSMADRRGSMTERRGSVAPLPGSRRASVLEVVQDRAASAVRRASLAMCA